VTHNLHDTVEYEPFKSYMTDISIIIVSYKGWGRLSKCLDSLKSFSGNEFKYEVIIVDNSSGDETIYEIEKQFADFRFIHNNVNGGYANGNNLGAKNAGGEFLLVLNPDTVVTESSVKKLLETARSNPEYSVISCRQFNEAGKEVNATGPFLKFRNITGIQRSLLKLIRGKADTDFAGSSVVFPDWVSGSVILIKRELYNRMGGFFEGYWMYFEDMDLCRRVTDAGGKIVLLNETAVGHNHGGSSRINLNTASITKTEVQISRHVYVSRNMKGAERVFIQIFLVINNLVSGAILAIAGIVFFFIPKMFIRTIIYVRLSGYYIGSLFRGSWISPRAVKPLIINGLNAVKDGKEYNS
jgi:GT2 family glycosyltransferase